MDIFLDRSQRQNSKTYYYVRLVSENQIGLIVHSEDYKNELKKQYIKLQRGWEVIPIYNIQNEVDIYTIKDRFKRGTLKGLIYDNMITRDFIIKNNIKYYEIIKLNWLNDDEIRDVILSNMAEGKYMYE